MLDFFLLILLEEEDVAIVALETVDFDLESEVITVLCFSVLWSIFLNSSRRLTRDEFVTVSVEVSFDCLWDCKGLWALFLYLSTILEPL